MSKTPYQLWQKTEVAQCNRKHVLKLQICYSKKQKSFWFTSRFHPIAIRFWDASYLNHGAYESIQWFGIILGGYFFEEESTGILSNAQIDPFKSTQFKVEKKIPRTTNNYRIHLRLSLNGKNNLKNKICDKKATDNSITTTTTITHHFFQC